MVKPLNVLLVVCHYTKDEILARYKYHVKHKNTNFSNLKWQKHDQICIMKTFTLSRLIATGAGLME